MSGLSGMPGGSLGFSEEGNDAVLFVDMHDAEAGGLHARHLEAADGDIGAGVGVLLEHQLVVHLVDVIAGQHDDVLGRVAADDVEVLVNRVRGAGVPLGLRHALAGGQDIEALVALGAQEVPAALQMADEAVRLVLGGDGDAADAGVERVRQGEVDDAGLATEEHGRLGALVGQFEEPASPATGQHIGHRIARQRRLARQIHHGSPPESRFLRTIIAPRAGNVAAGDVALPHGAAKSLVNRAPRDEDGSRTRFARHAASPAPDVLPKRNQSRLHWPQKPPPTRQPLAGRDTSFRCSSSISLIMAGNGIVAPVLSLYALQFGVSGALVGMMITIFGIGRLFANLPTGILSERYGRRLFICLGPATIVVGAVGAAIATTFAAILMWRFVQGVGSGIYMTVSGTVLMQVARPGERGRVMAMYQGSLLLGGGVGPAIGGFLAQHLGYAAPFWGLAAVATAALVLALTTFEEPPAASHEDASAKARPASFFSLFSLGPYLLLCLITFGVFFTRTASQWVLIPLVGHTTFGLSVDTIGLALSVSAVANFAMLPVVGPAIDRIGPRPITIVSTILTGTGLAIIGLSTGIHWFWVAIVLLGVGGGLSGSAIGAALAHEVPPSLYGPAMGLQRMIGDAAFVSGPIVVGFLSDVPGVGNSGGLLVNAALMIGAGAIYAVGSRAARTA